jgi:cell division protease FtsH
MPNFENMTLLLEDDEFAEADAIEPATGAKPIRPDRVLVEALLKGRTTAIRAALRSSVPKVIHVVSPSPEWALALGKEIKLAHPLVRTLTVTEVKRDKNAWIVPQLQVQLITGLHSIFSTTDVPKILPIEVEGTIDLRLELPRIDVARLNSAIRAFCGQRANGLSPEDIEKLDFPDLVMAMRPGSSAKDCVRRIKALAEKQRMARLAAQRSTGPRLGDLPLPVSVRGWAMSCLDELIEVSEGALGPQQLRFAVLEGPPGTGKTMIAEALARSAGWHLATASMGDWFNSSDGHLGGVSKAIVRFFDTLLETDNCVGFIDELDGLPDRATLDARDRQWWTPIVNLFIKQIDRVRSAGKPVMIIGATNFFERLDKALVRPGRMEQHVHVPVPETEDEIRAIFAHYLAPDIPASELGSVASIAAGASPAQIESWVKEARGLARHDDRELTLDDVLAVVAPPDDRTPAEIRATAIHEAGHAFIATRLGIGIKYVSIIAKGGSGGVTRTVPAGGILNRQQLEDIVTVSMAGRAADLVLGDLGAHSGAAIDIQMATALLLRGLCEWGLYDTLGSLDSNSEAAFDFADEAVKRLLHRALKLITLHRPQVLTLASELQTRRFLKGDAVKRILDRQSAGEAGAEAVAGASNRKPRKALPNAQVTPK